MIKDDDKLGWKQTNKHKAKVHHCDNGLHGFTTQANGTKHLRKGCMVEVGQRLEMPKEHENIEFMHHFEERFPFVIYADFECLTVPRHKNPYNETDIDIYGAEPPRSQFKTEIYQVHTLVVLWWTQWIQLKILQNNACTKARKVWKISVWN